MAQQSRGQKRTVERVMHEFKHGELESSRGGKVKSRRQAVAIALSEAGASRNETPKQNRRNLARTKRRERSGTTRGGTTKAELYAQAKRRNIRGRSRMSKAQLDRALHG
jgi:Family of unknown function (DUF6496)